VRDDVDLECLESDIEVEGEMSTPHVKFHT